MTEAEIIDAMADLEHDRWSGWMKYQASKVDLANKPGEERNHVERWQRQMVTKYADLSEQEKESDRAEARKTLDLLKRLGVVR